MGRLGQNPKIVLPTTLTQLLSSNNVASVDVKLSQDDRGSAPCSKPSLRSCPFPSHGQSRRCATSRVRHSAEAKEAGGWSRAEQRDKKIKPYRYAPRRMEIQDAELQLQRAGFEIHGARGSFFPSASQPRGTASHAPPGQQRGLRSCPAAHLHPAMAQASVRVPASQALYVT